MYTSNSTANGTYPSQEAENRAALIGFSVSLGLPGLSLTIMCITMYISCLKKKSSSRSRRNNAAATNNSPLNANNNINNNNGLILPLNSHNMGVLGRQLEANRNHNGDVDNGDRNSNSHSSGWDADSEATNSMSDPEAGLRNPPPPYVERWEDIELGIMPAGTGAGGGVEGGGDGNGRRPPGYFTAVDLNVNVDVNLSVRIEIPAVERSQPPPAYGSHPPPRT